MTVVSKFPDTNEADVSTHKLRKNGAHVTDISGMIPEECTYRVAHEPLTAKLSSGMVFGAQTGCALGALAGFILSIGAIVVPDISLILIGEHFLQFIGLSGAATTTLSAATTGTFTGVLLGPLVSLGIPVESAHRYAKRVKVGGIVLTTPLKQKVDKKYVKNIFELSGTNRIHTVH